MQGWAGRDLRLAPVLARRSPLSTVRRALRRLQPRRAPHQRARHVDSQARSILDVLQDRGRRHRQRRRPDVRLASLIAPAPRREYQDNGTITVAC
jgi:hypothetical protein